MPIFNTVCGGGYKYLGGNYISDEELPYPFEAGRGIEFNGELNILGGSSYFSGTTEAHYKLVGDSWVKEATLNFSVGSYSALAVLNNELYVLGANDTNNVYKFDGSNWLKVSDLPVSGANCAVAFNGELHFLYGENHYKLQENSWVKVSDFPINSYGCGMVVWRGKLCALCGANTGKKIYSFNGSGWVVEHDGFIGNYSMAYAVPVVLNDEIHAIGSSTLHSVFDGENWRFVKDIPYDITSSSDGYAAVCGSTIHIFGGNRYKSENLTKHFSYCEVYTKQ